MIGIFNIPGSFKRRGNNGDNFISLDNSLNLANIDHIERAYKQANYIAHTSNSRNVNNLAFHKVMVFDTQ